MPERDISTIDTCAKGTAPTPGATESSAAAANTASPAPATGTGPTTETSIAAPATPAPAAAPEAATTAATTAGGKRRLSSMAVFILSAFAWMAVLIGAWMMTKQWTSYPVGSLAGMALETGAPMWVKQTINTPGNLEVDTRVDVLVPGSGGRRAEIVLDVDPARYAYGLPIFLALLFAARGKKIIPKALLGYVALLPFQAFTVVFYTLTQILIATQLDIAQLRITPWQREAIIYGYQFGTLIVPTLLPIIIWLVIDREFFVNTISRGFFARHFKK